MQKEKRSNLAIYALAGSILISSVIISNQANGASKNTTPPYVTLEQGTQILSSVVNLQKRTTHLEKCIENLTISYNGKSVQC
jgi:hypothetical protein